MTNPQKDPLQEADDTLDQVPAKADRKKLKTIAAVVFAIAFLGLIAVLLVPSDSNNTSESQQQPSIQQISKEVAADVKELCDQEPNPTHWNCGFQGVEETASTPIIYAKIVGSEKAEMSEAQNAARYLMLNYGCKYDWKRVGATVNSTSQFVKSSQVNCT